MGQGGTPWFELLFILSTFACMVEERAQPDPFLPFLLPESGRMPYKKTDRVQVLVCCLVVGTGETLLCVKLSEFPRCQMSNEIKIRA